MSNFDRIHTYIHIFNLFILFHCILLTTNAIVVVVIVIWDWHK